MKGCEQSADYRMDQSCLGEDKEDCGIVSAFTHREVRAISILHERKAVVRDT